MSTPFLLTEIALELLGNSFYDINGQIQKDLKEIFKSCPNGDLPLPSKKENLMSQLAISEIGLLPKPNKECVAYFFDQFLQVVQNSAANKHGKCVFIQFIQFNK